MSGEYHERYEDLTQEAIEYHRIIKSVIEEFEAAECGRIESEGVMPVVPANL